MTKEQWLVYLWSIYPNGEFMHIWGFSLFAFSIGMIFVAIHHFGGYEDNTSLWSKMGKWKAIIPSILILFMFISYLVPKREYFAYIIATPYAVDSGKSIVESLQDPNSKLSKLNSIMDKGLDKIIIELEKPDSEIVEKSKGK